MHAPIALKQLLPEFTLPAALAKVQVTQLTLDSRQVKPGTLFLALAGTREHGVVYLPQAIAAGAVAVLVEASADLPALPDNALVVPDLGERVSEIAARCYGLPGSELHIVGVTGTNGKTTCTQLLANLYHVLGERASVMGTMGFGLAGEPLSDTGMTTPDAVSFQAILRELRNRHARHLAVEVSSHALSQHRLAAVPVQTAVFTNLTRDHLDYHGDMTAYGEAKRKLFSHLGVKRGIVNIDDEFGKSIVAKAGQLPVVSYGLAKNADVRATDVRYHTQGLQASIQTPWGSGELRSQLIGAFNLHNLLAVVATACAEGYGLDEVLAALPTLRPVTGRMELITGDDQVQAVVDYAHTPDALRAVLEASRAHCRGQLWCVFGCGGDRDSGKRPQMAAVAEQLADRVVVTSDNPRTEDPLKIIDDIRAGFRAPADIVTEPDRAKAIRAAIAQADTADWVVVAGKGHEDYQIIGKKKFPFYDQTEVRAALAQRAGGGQ